MILRDYLEADIIDNCNLRCQHCSHHSPYMENGVYALDQFAHDVRNLSKVLHVKKFRILGGEPLLNKDLPKYISILREYNLADSVGLCTNGILLNTVNEKLLSKIDFLDISLYLDLEDKVLEGIRSNIDRLVSIDESKITVEEWRYFRATETLVKNTNQHLVNEIWKSCYVKSLAHAIYKGYYVRCTASQNKGKFLRKMGVDGVEELLSPGTDGINLDTPNLEDALKAYIESDAPLRACRWCLGVSSKKIPHSQQGRGQRNNMVNTGEELQEVVDFNQNIQTRAQLKTVVKKGKFYIEYNK